MQAIDHRQLELLQIVDGSAEPIKSAKPVIKWAGGKQALVSQLISIFPKKFSRYYEPFIGGASVLINLSPPDAVIGDQNHWLLDMYTALRDSPSEVAAALNAFPNTRDEYLRVRAIVPSSLDIVLRAAHFIYLNKTCFRGLFRVNKKGQFNVPYGAYDRRYFDEQNLKAVSRILSKVTIRAGDFEHCLSDITNNDFAYLDPPYWKVGGYADFDRYTALKFHAADQKRLAILCQNLTNKGVRFAVSNSDTPFVRELYNGFRIHEIQARREINLKSSSRDITELIITNF